jgi:alkylation response protein AidB-like acyl-CoA dehydrogenase
MLHWRMYGLDGRGCEWAEKARRLAAETARPAAAEVDRQGRFPAEGVQALAQGGFLGLCLPATHGGAGQGGRVYAAAVEELAGACPSAAMIYVMHVSAAQTFVASNRLADRDRLLREAAAGRHLTTLAFSERGSRSQFWAPVSRLAAGRDSEPFVTSASKSWVTSSHHADSYVASGQAPSAESPLDSVLYLVDRTAPGVHIGGGFDGLGLRGNDSCAVEFRDVAVEPGRLLCAPGDGLSMMLETVLPWFCIGTAAMANGICSAALSAVTTHLANTGFTHDGSRLRDLPNLRARAAEISTRTQQSRALLASTLDAMEQSAAETPILLLQSRLAALEAALGVTDLAMRACGGAAFSRQLGVERLFRDARAGWVMAPTADHLLEFVGRALTGLPLM